MAIVNFSRSNSVCIRCPKVYHLYCYIPPLSDEPADDWVCLSCSSRDEIFSVGNYNLYVKIKKKKHFSNYKIKARFKDCIPRDIMFHCIAAFMVPW